MIYGVIPYILFSTIYSANETRALLKHIRYNWIVSLLEMTKFIAHSVTII